MKEAYLFEYVNENEFKKLESTLKKYNMLAYKKLYSNIYPALKEGNFLGQVVSTNQAQGTKTYELKLPTDYCFSKKYGDFELHYMVYEREKIVMLDILTPVDILSERQPIYEDVMASKRYSDKDLFKINLLDMIQK